MPPKKTTVRRAPPKKRELAKEKKSSLNVRMPGEIKLYEAGTSGIKEYQGFVEQAYLSQLYWPQVYPEYNRLRRSMPEMAMVRQLFTVLSRSVSPSIELPPTPSDDDKKYQDFVESEFDNMEGGFNQLIETSVNQVPFMGWGRWEAVPGLRDVNWKPPQSNDDWRSEEDDGLIGIRRLAWRDQGTLEKWNFDDAKKMIGMWQKDFPRPSVYLPNRTCLHLTFGDPNNPEGLAGLEPIYRLERIRFGFEVIMGIGYEHAAGYLDVTKTEGTQLTDDDVHKIERAAMNVLTAKEGNFAAWPPGIVGALKDVPFQAGTSILSAIGHYNILALSVFLAQFIAFNTLSGTGSYASSTDASQIAITAFNSMMDGFANQIDRQIGRWWWDMNKDQFPGLTRRPRLKLSHASKNVELGILGQFIGQIKDTIPLGEDDLVAIRKRTEFMPETLPQGKEVINPQATPDGQKAPAPSPFPPSNGAVPPNANTNGKKPTMDPSMAKLMVQEALEQYSRGEPAMGETEYDL